MNHIINDDFLYSHMKDAESLMMAAIPPETKLNHNFSKRFLRKMKSLLKYERRTPMMRSTVHYAKTAAAVFLIFLSIAFTTTMSVEAYRIRFFEIVTTVWEELTSIVIGSEENAGHDTLVPLEPSYVPTDYGVLETSINQFEQNIFYHNKSGNEIFYSQNLTTQGEFIIDTESTTYEKIELPSMDVYYVVNKGVTQLYWQDAFYTYTLISTIEKDELLAMAQSVKK